MTELLTVLRAFLSTHAAKVSAKARWTSLRSSQPGYLEARAEFRRCDETAEVLFAELLAQLQALRGTDELEDTFEQLVDGELDSLRSILRERGLATLLEDQDGSFEGLLRKVRKFGALLTAAKTLNFLRGRCSVNWQFVYDEFQAVLESAPQANIEPRAWKRVVAMVKRDIERALAATPQAEIGELVSRVVFQVESDARKQYDKWSERLVSAMQVMVERGTFEREVAQLKDGLLRTTARDFLSRVPKLQRQTAPKPEPRALAAPDEEGVA